MKSADIRKRLRQLQDPEYKEFSSSLMPSVDPKTVIGVRTPELRKLAKEVSKDGSKEFLDDLPHKYFEENQLHAFVVSLEKDFDDAISRTDKFLPYIDNWATCDQFAPKAFDKNHGKLLEHVECWISSDKTYTCRFGVVMMMRHFLDDDFKPEYLAKIADVKSDEYYVNMARAWYFATALAKQYDETLPYIKDNKLDTWTHNKAIQKARESRRVDQDRKDYLNTLKRKS